MKKIATEQLTVLSKNDYLKEVKKVSDRTYFKEKNDRV